MKNEDLWRSYKEYTEETTKHARQLGFAGAAICWFFRYDDATFPPLISLALLVFVVYFALDVAQYVVAAKQIRDWTRGEENRRFRESGTIDGEYEKPEELDTWPYRLFALKLGALTAAFGTLGIEFISRLL